MMTKIDRAHDAVAELLMNQFLDCGTINGDDFVPAVNQRIGGDGGRWRPFVGRDLEPGDRLVGKSEDSADLFRLLLIERHLAKAPGCRPFLALPDRPGNLSPAYVFLDLGCADRVRHFAAVGNHRELHGLVEIRAAIWPGAVICPAYVCGV